MATTSRSDQFIMLLSADWFTPFWRDFGLVLAKTEQETVQRVARKVVETFLKEAETYWGADLNDARIRSTCADFLTGLRRAGLEDTVVTQISEMLIAAEESSQTATTTWLFSALLDQLFASAQPGAPGGMSANAVQTLRLLWESSETTPPGDSPLEEALLASETPWDRFLRNKTPDIPTYLSDWATTRLATPDRFRRVWAQLYWLIPAADSKSLKIWLEQEAGKLADPTFVLAEPLWMRDA